MTRIQVPRPVGKSTTCGFGRRIMKTLHRQGLETDPLRPEESSDDRLGVPGGAYFKCKSWLWT